LSDIKLLNGDCLIENEKIESGSVDLILTDLPYLHIKGGMKSKRINLTGIYKSDSFMNTKMRDFDKDKIKDLLSKLIPLMRETFNGYFFCSKLQIIHYLNWAVSKKLSYDILIWDRQKTGLISTKFFNSNIDYVVRIYGKGQALNKINNHKTGKARVDYYSKLQSYKQPKLTGHETEKPIEMIKKYILLSSSEGDTVLDPFMGSGTTGVACRDLKRNFIGIEIEKKYFEIAKKRVSIVVEKMF